MSTAPRIVIVLSAAAVLAAITPTANAAPQGVPPEPAVVCQNDIEAYIKASGEIHAAQWLATISERRTLHRELIQLGRDLNLEPC